MHLHPGARVRTHLSGRFRLCSLVIVVVMCLVAGLALTQRTADAVVTSTITTTSEPAIRTGNVWAFAFVGSHVWTASDYGAVVEIDPSASDGRQIIGSVAGLSGRVRALAAIGTDLWALTESGLLYRIDTAAVGGPVVSWSIDNLYGAPYRNVASWQLRAIGSKLYLFSGSSLVELDTLAAGGPAITQTLQLPQLPFAIAADGNHIWVSLQCASWACPAPYHGGVAKVDPNAVGGMAIVATFDSGGQIATYVNVAFGSVWVLDLGDQNDPTEPRKVVRLDPTTGAVLAEVSDGTLSRVSVGPQDNVVQVGSELWITCSGYSSVVRIDTTLGAEASAGAIGAPFDQPGAIANDGRHVWLSQFNNQPRIAELDPTVPASPTVVAQIEHGFFGISRPGQVTVVDGLTWVANGTGTISIVDPLAVGGPRIVDTMPVGISTVGLHFDGTHVWASDGQENGSVLEIDPFAIGGPAIIDTIGGFSFPTAITSDGSHVWVVNQGFYYSPGPGGVSEIDPEADGGAAVVNWVQTDKGGDGLYFDGTYLYMSVIAWDGGMTIIDPYASGGPVVVADQLSLANRPMALDADGLIWMINRTDGTVEQISIDPTSPSDAPIVLQTVSFTALDSGLSVASLSFDGVHLWVGTSGWTKGYISEIDPVDASIMQSISVNDGSKGWYFPKSIFADGQFAIASMGDGATVLYATVPTPDAPMSVSASPADAGAEITWTEPAHAGTSPIESYRVTATSRRVAVTETPAVRSGIDGLSTSSMHPEAVPGCTYTVPASGTPTNTCTIGGLENGTDYTVTVQAVNAVGVGLSESTTVRPVAGPITTTTTVTSSTSTTSTVTSSTTTPDSGSTGSADPTVGSGSDAPESLEGSSGLPITGSETRGLLALAIFVLVAGSTAVLASRRGLRKH